MPYILRMPSGESETERDECGLVFECPEGIEASAVQKLADEAISAANDDNGERSDEVIPFLQKHGFVFLGNPTLVADLPLGHELLVSRPWIGDLKSEAWTPQYSRWRHGGWYVTNLHYPSGACGCVSRNYPDRKWRIACDGRRTALGEDGDYTFSSRDEAARAEFEQINLISFRTGSEERKPEIPDFSSMDQDALYAFVAAHPLYRSPDDLVGTVQELRETAAVIHDRMEEDKPSSAFHLHPNRSAASAA